MQMPSQLVGDLENVCSSWRKEDNARSCTLKRYEQKAGFEHKLETVLAALKSSGNSKDIETGMKIHASLAATGDDSRVEIINGLVHMYVKCGSMTDASRVFQKLSQPSTVLWNTLISGYLENKEFDFALFTFERMQEEGCTPNSQSFIAALKACASLTADEQARKIQGKLVKLSCLEKGLAIHSTAKEHGYEQELAVGNTLVHMFAKCRSMTDAVIVFQRMPKVSSVSWTALIFGYVENGESLSALETFKRMQDEGFKPTALTYVGALKACAKSATKEEYAQVDGKAVKVWSLETGMATHCRARSQGYEPDPFLANTIVDMYAKCGCLDYALEAFKAIQRPSVVSWNTLMSGCAEAGDSELALRIFQRMQRGGVTPNSRSYVAALDACANLAAKEQPRPVEGKLVKPESLHRGRAIHSLARKDGYELKLQVGNTITHMYAKCGSLVEAVEVFHRMPVHDIVSYNILMFGYIENGDGEAALRLYTRMRNEGLSLSSLTYVAALKACACAGAREDEKGKAKYLVTGREIHCQARKSGWETDIFVASTLLDMYSKCRSMSDAREVFDKVTNHDVVSWNAMIFGYEEAGEAELALEFFERMKASGCRPDGVTYLAVLKACAACAGKSGRHGRAVWLKSGEAIRREIDRSGCELDMFLASTLVDFYAKCGVLDEARQVFDGMSRRDVVSWNAVIYGYTESGELEMALELFRRMQRGTVKPNVLTYTALFKACGGLAALETGRNIHAQICREGVQESSLLVSSLVDFYGKCGSTMEAEQVFVSMGSSTKVAIWNALMSGYAHQGKSKRVFEMLMSMQDENVKPDGITFLALLTACAQAGLENKGRMFLQRMRTDEFNVTPGIKHYTCMVDLLGRSNRLDEAVKVVQQGMDTEEADVAIWRSVLYAATRWRNVQAGKVAFESIKRLEPREVSAYVLMGNIYGALGMWEQKALVWEEKCRLECTRGGEKSPCLCWWTDSDGKVHRFKNMLKE